MKGPPGLLEASKEGAWNDDGRGICERGLRGLGVALGQLAVSMFIGSPLPLGRFLLSCEPGEQCKLLRPFLAPAHSL